MSRSIRSEVPPGPGVRMTPGRYITSATVLAFDRPAGKMVLKVRYKVGGYYPRSPYPPLVVPVPQAAPAWLFQIGVVFKFTHPAGREDRGDYERDPDLMADFEPLEYWWATTGELEECLGVFPDAQPVDETVRRRRIEAARAAVESRRPLEYVPTAEEVAAAADCLRATHPEWVGVARYLPGEAPDARVPPLTPLPAAGGAGPVA